MDAGAMTQSLSDARRLVVKIGSALLVEDSGEIRQAWLDHLVIAIRGQQLTDPEFVAFGKRFGECQI